MDLQFPNAMLSWFLVRGLALTLVARSYPLEDWYEATSATQQLENVVYVFHRSADGRVALVARVDSIVAIRVIVEPESGKQYFVHDQQHLVTRIPAVKGWDWSSEYDRLEQSAPSTQPIGKFQACLAISSQERAGIHELWVNLDLRIPIAEVFPSFSVVVDHVIEGEPEAKVFEWPLDYTVTDAAL